MSTAEIQEEEREVLFAIYDGVAAFKELSPTTFQYKYGENEGGKSFLLEISWGKTYPEEKPIINMDTFYNNHIIPEVKEKILSSVDEVAEKNLGQSMTYTLFEFVKDNVDKLLTAQPDGPIGDIVNTTERGTISEAQETEAIYKKPVKKEHLSKAQKRKQWDKVDAKGEKPRGSDWVDVVKHLSQTGAKQPTKQNSPSPTS